MDVEVDGVVNAQEAGQGGFDQAEGGEGEAGEGATGYGVFTVGGVAVEGDGFGDAVNGEIAGDLKTGLAGGAVGGGEGESDAGDFFRDEFGVGKFIGFERAALDVAVAHVLIAFEIAEIEYEFGFGGVEGAVGEKDDRAGDRFRGTDGVIGEVESGELLLDAVGCFGAGGNFQLDGGRGGGLGQRLRLRIRPGLCRGGVGQGDDES